MVRASLTERAGGVVRFLPYALASKRPGSRPGRSGEYEVAQRERSAEPKTSLLRAGETLIDLVHGTVMELGYILISELIPGGLCRFESCRSH